MPLENSGNSMTPANVPCLAPFFLENRGISVLQGRPSLVSDVGVPIGAWYTDRELPYHTLLLRRGLKKSDFRNRRIDDGLSYFR